MYFFDLVVMVSISSFGFMPKSVVEVPAVTAGTGKGLWISGCELEPGKSVWRFVPP